MQRDQLDKPGDALATIDKMKEDNPNAARAYVLHAQFLLSDKDPTKQQKGIREDLIEQATADCDKALELEPKNPEAMLLQVTCIERAAEYIEDGTERGAEYARAENILKEVIELKPEEPRLYLQWGDLELRAAQSVGTAEAYESGTRAAIAAVREGLAPCRCNRLLICVGGWRIC